MKNTPASKPQIIVLAHSKAWSSLIRRTFAHANLRWVLDADAILEEASNLNAQVAIVEVPIASVADLSVQLSLLTNNSNNLKIFAVGGSDLYRWRRLLRIAGVAMSCWSTLQAGSLAQAVGRHLGNSTATGHQTLESLVESDLPWPTAAKSSTA